YALKHLLLQEVVYRSLQPAERQAFHAAMARALERQHADALEQVYDQLAYHYGLSAQAPEAIACGTRFAELAAHHGAHTEARAILREAMRHVDRLPAAERDACRLRLLLRQAQSALFLGQATEATSLLLQQQTRLASVHDVQLTAQYTLILSQTAQHLGEWDQAAQ